MPRKKKQSEWLDDNEPKEEKDPVSKANSEDDAEDGVKLLDDDEEIMDEAEEE